MSSKFLERFLCAICLTCLPTEQSMPVRVGEHVASLTRYVGEKLFVDLISRSETYQGKQINVDGEGWFQQILLGVFNPE